MSTGMNKSNNGEIMLERFKLRKTKREKSFFILKPLILNHLYVYRKFKLLHFLLVLKI